MKKGNIINMMKKVKKAIWTAYMTCIVASMGAIVAFADAATEPSGGGTTATTMWNTILDAIKPFLIGLGGVLVLVGGINMAIGFKSEDSDGITRGTRTLIAGVAVIAVVGVAWAFVKI